MIPTHDTIYFIKRTSLKSGGESLKSSDSLGVSTDTGFSLVKGSSSVSILHSLEEDSSLLLLGDRGGKSTDGSTGLVHVTGEFILYVEPFLPLYISGDLGKTLLGLSNNGHLTSSVFSIIGLVEGLLALGGVDRVRRVNLLSLITSVSSSLGVRGSVSDNSEYRETGGLSYSSVSSNGKESSSGSNKLSENLTTGLSIYSGGDTSVIGLKREREMVSVSNKQYIVIIKIQILRLY